MIVYRVVHKAVTQLLTGSGNDARWCSGGRKVIYTSSSVALACLENVIRRSGSGFSEDFRTIFYNIPDSIPIEEVKLKNLTNNWRLQSSYYYCQLIGNKWYDSKESLVLKVPSAIIPDEYNYIIKTTSPKINRITIKDVKPFVPDVRLENILTSVDVEKLKKASSTQKKK
ncbi:MAG: RES family NAD+ phosphorylase [Parafilimonas sp.]|nr:RES family NAD+ phosphorylase [Parafilimonas sp.]